MELRITNFRSIAERTITVPLSGTVSITGASGAGKSTILDSIHFVLYGARMNVAPRGENVSTKVTLSINDLFIDRRKRPNLLLVKYGDHEYEGESAQGIIDTIFGSEQMFNIASYIKQGKSNGFVGMSDAAKKALILDLAIGYDIESMKATLDGMIRSGKTERYDAQVKVERSQVRLEPYTGKKFKLCENARDRHEELKTLQALRFNDAKLRDELTRTKTILEFQPNTDLSPEEIASKLKDAEKRAQSIQQTIRTNRVIIEKKRELNSIVTREPVISEADLSRLKYLKPHSELIRIRDAWKVYSTVQSIEMVCPFCDNRVHRIGDKLHKEEHKRPDCVKPKFRPPSEDDIAFALKHSAVDIKSEEMNWASINRRKSLMKFENVSPKDPKALDSELETIQTQIVELRGLRGKRKINTRPLAQIQAELDAELEKSKTTSEKIRELRLMLREHNQAVQAHKLKTELRNNQIELDAIDSKLTSLEHLKAKIDISCSELLETFLESINHTINGVLAEIFEEPIDVRIKSFKDIKTTKSVKASLNMDIVYRGMTFDKLSGLSGGEQSRVSLAMLIAFAHVSPSKIVMIDESMSTLHVDMRISAIECMKSWLPDHLILIVNHDTSDSDYDFTLNA